MRVGLACAPWLTTRQIERVAGGLAWVGPRCPVLARLVADNMRRAGVYSPGSASRALSAACATSCGGVVCRFGTGAASRADFLAAAREQFELDESVDVLRSAAQRGGGAVLASPHFAAFTYGLPVLSAAVPLSVYFRTPKTAERRETKERWCAIGGLRPILEPHDHERSGRLAPLMEALRAGQVLYVPPDLAHKRGDGVAVQWLGRVVHLPAGAGVLAQRTGAPLFLLTATQRGARVRLGIDGPAPSPVHRAELSAADNVRAAVGQQLQWFATAFEGWVKREPALWYSWADKRWTRVLRNDAAFVGPAGEDGAAGERRARPDSGSIRGSGAEGACNA